MLRTEPILRITTIAVPNSKKIESRRPKFVHKDVAELLNEIKTGKAEMKVDKGNRIFSQGDKADAIYFVETGRVKISVVSTRGKEAVLVILAAHDFFGEGCLTGQSLRLATAATMTESVITRIDKAAMVRVLHDEPKFTERFLAYLLEQWLKS